jgi:hypothetical protein
MVYKKKGSCKWWYGFTFHGRRYQKSSGVENRKEAEGIEAAFRTSLAKGEVGVTDRPRFTIDQLLDPKTAVATRREGDHSEFEPPKKNERGLGNKARG